MIELEIGKTYSTKELYEALGVSKSVFSHKKDQYLKQISLAYHYEVEYKGRSILYTITEKIGDYQKPERKNAREKIDKTIRQFINETIEEDPMQTAANINRRAWEDHDTHPSEVVLLGLKEGTTNEYIRLNLREMYGTKVNEGGTDGMIEKKVWCHLNKEYNYYEEMPQDMIDRFYECFNEVNKEQKHLDINIANDYKIGLITREEYLDKLGEATMNKFTAGRKKFYDRYGYYPIRVPVYIKDAEPVGSN